MLESDVLDPLCCLEPWQTIQHNFKLADLNVRVAHA